MSRRPRASRLVALLLFASAAGARTPPESASDLGRIDFPTSGGAPAQAHFLRGALLLHSFEYEDAAEEFRAAQEKEPGFAMAFWGEAMTYNHPLWSERDRDAAMKALERLGPTPEARRAKAPTERERLYLDAVERLYAEGEKADRDRAYADAMERLAARFPDDLDAASFYALALLGTCEGVRDVPTYMRAAAIVEEVFAKNPQHPGAAHYLIHSYDDPVHAPLGMRAARAYARIAPAAAHALHMPSHIFLASGLWTDVVASNEASWQASLDRAARKKLGADAHGFHALFWLEYAYLQQGRYADARRTLALMEEDARRSGSTRTRSHLVSMRAAYVVETGRWKGDAAGLKISSDDLSSRNLDRFVAGLAAVESGDRAAAEKILAEMPDSPAGKAGEAHDHGGPPRAYSDSRPATDAILRSLLEAKILFSRGERDRAITLAREAAARQDALSYEFGPPDVVKPSHELAGEMLLAAGRPKEARSEFEASLALAPGRSLSLLGLARSSAASGDADGAAAAYAKLREIWSRADADVAGLSETRRGSPAGGS